MSSDKQEAARLNKQLDVIWRLGDRDECSIKHIYWGLSALMINLSWKDGLDYSTPWGGNDHPFTECPPESVVRVKAKQLESAWAKVTAKRDAWGLDKFLKIVRLTKFDWAENYCEFYEDR